MSETPDIETQAYGSPRSAQEVLAGAQGSQDPNPAYEAAQEPPEAAPGPVVEEPPTKAFDPRHREALTGLLYLGRLEDTFEWGGHTFHIRTLTAGEQIRAGIMIKPALGTRVEMKAYQSATVAAGLITVDGEPIVVPLGTDDVLHKQQYDYILAKWHALTIDAIYTRIYELEIEARKVADALGEALRQGL